MPETTQLNADGQVLLPAQIRQDLNLKTGDRFEVTTRENQIILRRVDALPSAKELEQFLAMTKKTGAGNKVIDTGKPR